MLRRALFLAFFVALASSAAEPARPGEQSPAKAAGGDAAPKATMEVVFESPDEETSPPVPQGDERRSIGDFIRDHGADIRECYAKRLQERPTLQGKLVARFDIGPSGKVVGAVADGIPDRDLQLCVVRVVRAWEFPPPQSGGKLRVAYPFKFEPQPGR